MKKEVIFVVFLFVIVFISACGKNEFSRGTFTPSTCGFDNEKQSSTTFLCGAVFRILTTGIEFGVQNSCNTVKASDCPRIQYNNLKVSGSCFDELDEIKGGTGNRVCTTGLVSGEQIEVDLDLSYTHNGEQKNIKGKIKGKVE